MSTGVLIFGSATRTRTGVYGVRGRCPRPLDDSTIAFGNLGRGLTAKPSLKSSVPPLFGRNIASLAFLPSFHPSDVNQRSVRSAERRKCESL